MKTELSKLIRKMWAHKLDESSRFEMYPLQAEAGAKLANEYSDDESVILIAACLYLVAHMDGKGADKFPHTMLLQQYNELYGAINESTGDTTIKSDDTDS